MRRRKNNLKTINKNSISLELQDRFSSVMWFSSLVHLVVLHCTSIVVASKTSKLRVEKTAFHPWVQIHNWQFRLHPAKKKEKKNIYMNPSQTTFSPQQRWEGLVFHSLLYPAQWHLPTPTPELQKACSSYPLTSVEQPFCLLVSVRVSVDRSSPYQAYPVTNLPLPPYGHLLMCRPWVRLGVVYVLSLVEFSGWQE